MGIGQAHVFAEFVIGFFAAAHAGFLFGSRNGIPFFQIVQIFLKQNIAAAGIRLAFGNNGNIAYIVIALRIFRTIDKTVQAAVFIQAQAVFFSGYADAVAECTENRLGQGIGGFLLGGLNVDIEVVLGRRGEAVAQFREGFDFTAFVSMSERLPCAAAEGNGQTQNIIWKTGF